MSEHASSPAGSAGTPGANRSGTNINTSKIYQLWQQLPVLSEKAVKGVFDRKQVQQFRNLIYSQYPQMIMLSVRVNQPNPLGGLPDVLNPSIGHDGLPTHIAPAAWQLQIASAEAEWKRRFQKAKDDAAATAPGKASTGAGTGAVAGAPAESQSEQGGVWAVGSSTAEMDAPTGPGSTGAIGTDQSSTGAGSQDPQPILPQTTLSLGQGQSPRPASPAPSTPSTGSFGSTVNALPQLDPRYFDAVTMKKYIGMDPTQREALFRRVPDLLVKYTNTMGKIKEMSEAKNKKKSAAQEVSSGSGNGTGTGSARGTVTGQPTPSPAPLAVGTDAITGQVPDSTVPPPSASTLPNASLTGTAAETQQTQPTTQPQSQNPTEQVENALPDVKAFNLTLPTGPKGKKGGAVGQGSDDTSQAGARASAGPSVKVEHDPDIDARFGSNGPDARATDASADQSVAMARGTSGSNGSGSSEGKSLAQLKADKAAQSQSQTKTGGQVPSQSQGGASSAIELPSPFNLSTSENIASASGTGNGGSNWSRPNNDNNTDSASFGAGPPTGNASGGSYGNRPYQQQSNQPQRPNNNNNAGPSRLQPYTSNQFARAPQAPAPPPPLPLEPETMRRKRKIRELLKEMAPGMELEVGADDALAEAVETFLQEQIRGGVLYAKHRKIEGIELKDVGLYNQHHFHLQIPGYDTLIPEKQTVQVGEPDRRGRGVRGIVPRYVRRAGEGDGQAGQGGSGAA